MGTVALIQRVEITTVAGKIGFSVPKGDGGRNVFTRLRGVKDPPNTPTRSDGKHGAIQGSRIEVAIGIDGGGGIDFRAVVRAVYSLRLISPTQLATGR